MAPKYGELASVSFLWFHEWLSVGKRFLRKERNIILYKRFFKLEMKKPANENFMLGQLNLKPLLKQ